MALLLSGAAAARAQDWRIDAGPMRIPTLEELSRPYTPRATTPVSPENAAGPLGAFLTDTSLRKGDIVATPDGLMEFRGVEGGAHEPSDFTPAEASAARSGRVRTLPGIQPPR
ncbi:MAG: hypothetical protein K2Y29_09540 [Beijerinckiaceae bacterium]|nr:hypothetical protein [Beijerinckiaceae bacterium]